MHLGHHLGHLGAYKCPIPEIMSMDQFILVRNHSYQFILVHIPVLHVLLLLLLHLPYPHLTIPKKVIVKLKASES